MRKSNLISIFFSLILVGCQYSSSDTGTLTTLVNEGYFNDLDSVTIGKERDEINFVSGQQANNCATYLKEVKKSAVKETVNDQIIHAEYLMCEVYDQVKGTTIVKQKFDENFGGLLSSKLDLTSFRSSLNRRARGDGPTLVDLGKKFLTTDESSVTYETEEWLYRLEVVAIIDLNHDGIQDWIVLLEDKSKAGNYHAGATLVVLGPTDATLLKAEPYSGLIK